MGRAKRNDGKRTSKSKQLLRDFEKKQRKKLGRKVLKPANVTEIKFRSHSVHITKQTLKSHSEMKSRLDLCQISQDIREALSHLSHQKGKVRRDVLYELKSILSRIKNTKNNEIFFKSVLHENLVQLVSIFELVYDHEFIVRDALKNFMNWFMPLCKNSIVCCIQIVHHS